ncbi:MAG: NUDIX hydrolase [Coleofasciculus sp. A1-SPW-01]|uniref:NUDIX hydrolase n=1 Tax=Coleofasciculus sp. A1-SPW-01 TaxID=3070819 RepID=UPI0032F2F968
MNKPRPWQTLDRFVEIRSPWLTLIGERLQDDQGQILDYWRVEKADSVVIVTIQAGKFLLPIPTYRPGVGEATLDFPGGRVNSEQTPITAVPGILSRELGVSEEAIATLTPLNSTGWAINSSFSNQYLYGFVAELDPTVAVNPNRIGITYPTTSAGIHSLLQELTCLQCRTVLLEWQSQRIIAEG